jgi:ATP-dependent exoDNAse (exonuclease V) beta subunit
MTKLHFYKTNHTYKYGKTELTSVTKFISQFFGKFDAKEVARKLAKFKSNKEAKRGVRYWLAEWKESSEHGTRVHNAIDYYISTGEIKADNDKDALKIAQGIGWLEGFLGTKFTLKERRQLILRSEVTVYDLELGLAGTIDLLIEHNGKGYIVDWKTNKKIEKKGYNKKMAKEPLESYSDCNYSKYVLQLSLYSKMLENKGLPIERCFLVHLKEDSVMPYEFNPQEYYSDIKEMIKWQRKNKTLTN